MEYIHKLWSPQGFFLWRSGEVILEAVLEGTRRQTEVKAGIPLVALR